MDIDLKTNVVTAYIKLTKILHKLKLALLKDDSYPIWLDNHEHYLNSNLKLRTIAYRIIAQLEYYDEQHPKETAICPGIIAASLETVDLINQLNFAKQEFKRVILALKQAKINFNDPDLHKTFENILPKRNINTATNLRKAGLSRLNLKQCYRNLVILNKKPYKITWTWAQTKAITKINVEQAIQRLQAKKQDYGIEQQIYKVQNLPKHSQLAIIQKLAPNLRANIVTMDATDKPERFMTKGHLPIFYLDDNKLSSIKTLPKFKPIKPKPQLNTTAKRADLKINPEPFLPAIRAHLYI